MSSRRAEAGVYPHAESLPVHHGDAASMPFIASNSVDLILTSPPYYPEHIESELMTRRSEQRSGAFVREALARFALSQRPVFEECRRVVADGGILIVQTKDIRYGDRLIGVAAMHRDLAESCDFELSTRVYWQRLHEPSSLGRGAAAQRRARNVGGFIAQDVEEFQVYTTSNGPRLRGAVDNTVAEIAEQRAPLWRLPSAPPTRRHPHSAPPRVLERLISLYSEPGDFVLDPFAGGGTTLHVAARMGRRVIGMDIDSRYATEMTDAEGADDKGHVS